MTFAGTLAGTVNTPQSVLLGDPKLQQVQAFESITWGIVYCAYTIWRAKLRWVASKGYLPNSIAYMMTPHDQISAFCTPCTVA